MRKHLSLFILLVTIVSSIALISYSQAATAAEPWKINVLSSLKDIDQFENRELTFEVKITDKKVIEFLSRPNTEIIGSAVLAPLEVQQLPTLSNNTTGTYTCYNPIPKALSGFTGGSALRMQKSSYENEITAKFSCWFPIGMRAQEYSLTISLSLNLNGSCCSMPNPNDWDNLQVFLFGNASDNFRPFWLWQRLNRNIWSPLPFATINRISEFEKVSVVRTQSKTDPANLTFNSKNISEMTFNLQKLLTSENNKAQEFSKNLEELSSIAKKAQVSIKSLLGLSTKSKYFRAVAKINDEITRIRIDLETIASDLNSVKPGSLENDVRLKYLYGLDFDAKGKPEVLVAQYPDFKKVESNPTPYLRFVVKSKTAIINADISPVFSSNVITLGSQPANDGWGGGLALVENQQWDGSMFVTSILVGPKYTPIDKDTLNRMRGETCTSGWFRDAAGNISTYWNYDISTNQCLPFPEVTQAISAANDFDNLVLLYKDLATANENLQKTKFIPDSLHSKTNLFSLFQEQIDLLKSQAGLISSQIKNEMQTSKRAVSNTIICIKKKQSMKVTGILPKCPSGFVKK